MGIVKDIILKNKSDKSIWNIDSKQIYRYLNTETKIKPKIEKEYPHVNWPAISKTLSKEKCLDKRSMVYRYLYRVLPTGDTLITYHVIDVLPMCKLCKKGKFEFKHLFHECSEFVDTREYHKEAISDIDADAGLDETTIRCGVGRIGKMNKDVKIVDKVFEYVYHIWTAYNNKLYARYSHTKNNNKQNYTENFKFLLLK